MQHGKVRQTALGGRKYYIDWLRNLAILYLFPYHTARVFDLQEAYYVEGVPGPAATALINVSFWFMPLLFLLAGLSSRYALLLRPAGAYVRERFRRLFVPLLAGLLVLVPPQAYYALRFHTGTAGDYPEFLWNYFTDWSDLTGYYGTFTPAQLWFIAFLLVISLGLLPLMLRTLRTGWAPRWLGRPGLVLLACAGLVLLAALPDLSGKNPFVYAGYFFLGFLVGSDEAIAASIARYRRRYLALAAAGTAGILWALHTFGWQSGFSPAGIAFTGVHYLACWAALLAILGYGYRYLNRPSALMAYLNQAGFPLFIVHQTFIVVIGFHILQAIEPAPLQYALILVLSLAASVACYELIRRVGILRMVFGLKPAAASARPLAAGAAT